MGASGSKVYDCDDALDELGNVFRELRNTAGPEAIVTWLGLAVWMNAPVDNEDEALTLALVKQRAENPTLPPEVDALIARWLEDAEEFASGTARPEAVTEVLGSYCDGPRYDALLALPESDEVIVKLANMATKRLQRALKSHLDLYELSGPMANLGILLELAVMQRWAPDRVTVAAWKTAFDARDAATKDERDFWDDYSAAVRRGFALLIEHAH